jgi:CheY-like chemotaxis protein
MGKKRILIIDDEESLTRALQFHLEETGQYDVRTEQRAASGLEAAHDFKPDLVLLDVIMPDMNGDHLAEQLRNDPLTKDVPVVFLTAIANKDDVGPRGGRIGGNLFLAKPVATETVIECIERELARHSAP